MSESPGVYAICKDCPETFADREVMLAHQRGTMAPTREETGVVARGHSVRVVNPTPEEIETKRVRGIVDDAIESALHDAMEELDRAVQQGKITDEQVARELLDHRDFSDAWFEFLQEQRDE